MLFKYVHFVYNHVLGMGLMGSIKQRFSLKENDTECIE